MRTKRKKQQHKEVENVVAYAESIGWRFVAGSGHAWAYLYCPSQFVWVVNEWLSSQRSRNENPELISQIEQSLAAPMPRGKQTKSRAVSTKSR